MMVTEQRTPNASLEFEKASDQPSHYVVQVSDYGYLSTKTQASNVTHEADEEYEDQILSEDISDWDVFDDYHKFQLREQKLKEKMKKQAQEEKKQIEKQRIEEI